MFFSVNSWHFKFNFISFSGGSGFPFFFLDDVKEPFICMWLVKGGGVIYHE